MAHAGRKWPLLLALAALLLPAAPARGASMTVQASVTILSQNNCRFRTAAAALDFGNLFGGATVDALATATIEMRCVGPTATATYAITDDDGLNETGPGARRMRHATNPAAYLPYELTYAPATATIPRLVWTPITISGRVPVAGLHAAPAGSYADTVTLTLLP